MKNRRPLLKPILILSLVALCGCYPGEKEKVKDPEKALDRVHFFYPDFKDDFDRNSLILALERNIEFLEHIHPDESFQYGRDSYTCRHVLKSQKSFLQLLRSTSDQKEIKRRIENDYIVYRAAGLRGQGKVLFTGYFQPLFEASLTCDDTYKYPIYRKPRDLIQIDLSLFDDRFKGQSIFARIEGKKVLPYFSRHQIEVEKALAGRGLEIAWLKDPIDVAFLHIQGSGTLRLPGGNTLTVGYEAKNGRPYRSIGKYLMEKDLISEEQMSMQAIREVLSNHPEIAKDVLNHNPSYVFFRILENGPMGSINVPVTPQRTLALDSGLFPRGALGFISCLRPVLDDAGRIKEWTKFSCFVLNQDTGGAIKGAGRADFFWGRGTYARIAAGHMKHEGELFILIKKPT